MSSSRINAIDEFFSTNTGLIFIIILTSVLSILVYRYVREKDKGRRKKRSKINSRTISTISTLMALGGLFFLIGAFFAILYAGSIVVVGNWVVFGTQPKGTFQIILVFWFALDIFLIGLAAMMVDN